MNLDFVHRETKVVEFLEEAAQAVGVGDAAKEGGGLSGGAVEEAVQAAGGLWVFLALRGWGPWGCGLVGCGGGVGVGEDALNAEELADGGPGAPAHPSPLRPPHPSTGPP